MQIYNRFNLIDFIKRIVIKLMSVTQVTEEIQVTGSLLSLNVFEEKLMRNFYIINMRLKRLDELQEIDIKIKALQKQQKFINNKMEAMAQKLPKDGSLSRNDMKLIAKDQVFEVLNSKDDRLISCKYTQDLLKQIQGLKVDLARIRVEGPEATLQKNNSISSLANKASFTAGQALLQQNKKSVPRQSLQDVLDSNQMSVVDNIIKSDEPETNPVLSQINKKFEDLYRRVQEIRISKMFNENADKQLQKFDKFQKYEQYELKSQQTTRKLKDKPMRLDGVKKQNIKGEMLKNDLYAQYQKAEMIRAEMNKTDGRKSLKGQSLTNFKQQTKNDIKIIDDSDKFDRMKPSRSVKKLERIQRRLKVDDIKDLNSVLKQIELRIQGRVTHEIFMGFVEDIEEKIQILRITKDPTNELSELRKIIYSLQNRMQAVIVFLQNSTNQDDALLVKKQWTCISCDKNVDKYNAKVGQHLNWDNLSSKKISPTKAGAFGQTGQLANKIRTLLQNQKIGMEQ